MLQPVLPQLNVAMHVASYVVRYTGMCVVLHDRYDLAFTGMFMCFNVL